MGISFGRVFLSAISYDRYYMFIFGAGFFSSIYILIKNDKEL